MPKQSKNQNKLLEAYIEEIVKSQLHEDFESDYGFTPSAGDYGPGGGDAGGGHSGVQQMYQTFIQPFVDVGKTVAYGVEKLSAQASTVVRGIVFGLPTLFIPFLDYDYAKFREEEKERVKEIENKYKDVLGRNWEAITSTDAFGLGFVLAPSAFLGLKLASKAPDVVLNILDDLTHGAQAVIAAAKQFHVALQGQMPDHGEQHELHEAADPKLVQTVQKLLKDPSVLQAINNNPVVKQGRQEAVNVLVDRVKKFMAAKTYDELQKQAPEAVGKVTQTLQASEKQGKMAPQEDAAAKANLIPQLKAKYKEFYIGKLNDMGKQDPQMKPFAQNAIKQIQALK